MLLSTGNKVACPGPGRFNRIKDFRRGERSASLIVFSACDQDTSVGQKSRGMSGARLVQPADDRPNASGRIPNLRRADRVIEIILTAGNQNSAICEESGRLEKAGSVEPASISPGASYGIG